MRPAPCQSAHFGATFIFRSQFIHNISIIMSNFEIHWIIDGVVSRMVQRRCVALRLFLSARRLVNFLLFSDLFDEGFFPYIFVFGYLLIFPEKLGLYSFVVVLDSPKNDFIFFFFFLSDLGRPFLHVIFLYLAS